MYFMFCKNLYSIWSPSFLIIGIDNISVTYLSGSCFFLCQWKIKHDLTCGCFLPSKDSGQAIPRVVESCIRFINLYGELLVVVTSLKSDREWILISQVCDFVEKWHYISFTDRQTDRQIGSLARRLADIRHSRRVPGSCHGRPAAGRKKEMKSRPILVPCDPWPGSLLTPNPNRKTLEYSLIATSLTH